MEQKFHCKLSIITIALFEGGFNLTDTTRITNERCLYYLYMTRSIRD